MKTAKYKLVRIMALSIAFLLLMVILWLTIVSITDYRPADTETPELSGSANKMPADKSAFSIASWNLGYFGLGKEMDFFYDGGKQVQPSEQQYLGYAAGGEAYIKSLDSIDFFMFQEIDRRSKRSYRHDQFKEISGLLPAFQGIYATNYKVWSMPIPLYSPMGRVLAGLAFFTRFPADETYRVNLPGHFYWPLRLFMLDRCFLFTRFKLDSGKDLVIINTHNEAFDIGNQRQQQMESLRKVMMEEYGKGNYVVVGGDWNMNPVGYDASGFTTGDRARFIQPRPEEDFFPQGWVWVFDPEIPSNRNVDEMYQKGRTPATVIDFFVVSPNVKVVEIKCLYQQFEWSDHHPVCMKFSCGEK